MPPSGTQLAPGLACDDDAQGSVQLRLSHRRASRRCPGREKRRQQRRGARPLQQTSRVVSS